jgi:hypothetical protein
MNKLPALICFLLVSLVFLNSCNSKSSFEIEATKVELKQESTTADDGASESQNEPESIDLNDTIDSTMVRVIDMKCAISVIPDTSWLNKQQEKLGEKWGYFLFNQRDKPTFWHNTHFDNELSEIFD